MYVFRLRPVTDTGFLTGTTPIQKFKEESEQ